MPSCVIVVENLPVPFDRRVWQEAQALRDDGWHVSVICPLNAQHLQPFEHLDGIDIYRHSLPLEGRGMMGIMVEYAVALFHETRLLLKIARHRGFDVIQVCNPPDILFLNTLPYRLLGKRVVFDHHDVCPELFAAKFKGDGLLHRTLQALLRTAEKLTMQCADLVIAANETYRELAIHRGGKSPDDVVTVYSPPDRSRMRRVEPNAALRGKSRLVLGYLGIIGDQDGVDHLVRMVGHLIRDHGHDDISAVVVGDGPALASVRELARNLELSDRITFTGYLRGDELLAALSTFDIGIIPDPVNPYNDKISMNKVFEYSALGIPSVAYPLFETRRLLENIGAFSEDDTPQGLTRACLTLIEDDKARLKLGRAAKTLADKRFDWAREREKYVAAYRRLVPAAKLLVKT
jgi:glycosyltransferase involved in cell wall biosynthesis